MYLIAANSEPSKVHSKTMSFFFFFPAGSCSGKKSNQPTTGYILRWLISVLWIPYVKYALLIRNATDRIPFTTGILTEICAPWLSSSFNNYLIAYCTQ